MALEKLDINIQKKKKNFYTNSHHTQKLTQIAHSLKYKI